MERWVRSKFAAVTLHCLALCLASTACHSRPAAPVVTPAAPAPFTLSVRPAYVLAGNPVRVTCFVPWDDNNRVIRWGIEGMSIRTDGIDKRQYTAVIERLECGEWQATCAVMDNAGHVELRTQKIESKGTCNDGGNG